MRTAHAERAAINPPAKSEDDGEAVGTIAAFAHDPHRPDQNGDPRVAGVQAALDAVLDPELDES